MQLNLEIPGSEFLRKTDLQSIYTDVMATIASSAAKITPPVLEKLLVDRYGLNKKQIKTIIRDLVFSGELTYIYEFGCTFLERSLSKPVRISRHVVLIPPGHSYRSKPNDVVVQITPGASFGAGNHPTTRLAIKAIEYALLGDPAILKKQEGSVLDIGTGSGILILTAVLGGMDGGLGIDIDPCARVEAAVNVKNNGLEDRITISEQTLDTIDHRYAMALANLRFPSLERLYPRLAEVTAEGGTLILSGIKTDEVDDLLGVYAKSLFKYLWSADELGWAGVVLQKMASTKKG
jgi:ribosomal protein L11 methyltransferase